MVEVEFYPAEEIKIEQVTYVIIFARYLGKWIFVREKGQSSWSLPAGHLESDETTFAAALRELHEETGMVNCELLSVNGYSVLEDGKIGYGQLFFAEVHRMGELPESEIAQCQLHDRLPNNLSYPDIQPYFYERVKEFLNEKVQLGEERIK